MPDNLARVDDPTLGRPPPCGGFITLTVGIDRGGNQEVGTQCHVIFNPAQDSEPVTVEVLCRAVAGWYANWCAMNNVK